MYIHVYAMDMNELIHSSWGICNVLFLYGLSHIKSGFSSAHHWGYSSAWQFSDSLHWVKQGIPRLSWENRWVSAPLTTWPALPCFSPRPSGSMRTRLLGWPGQFLITQSHISKAGAGEKKITNLGNNFIYKIFGNNLIFKKSKESGVWGKSQIYSTPLKLLFVLCSFFFFFFNYTGGGGPITFSVFLYSLDLALPGGWDTLAEVLNISSTKHLAQFSWTLAASLIWEAALEKAQLSTCPGETGSLLFPESRRSKSQPRGRLLPLYPLLSDQTFSTFQNQALLQCGPPIKPCPAWLFPFLLKHRKKPNPRG